MTGSSPEYSRRQFFRVGVLGTAASAIGSGCTPAPIPCPTEAPRAIPSPTLAKPSPETQRKPSPEAKQSPTALPTQPSPTEVSKPKAAETPRPAPTEALSSNAIVNAESRKPGVPYAVRIQILADQAGSTQNCDQAIKFDLGPQVEIMATSIEDIVAKMAEKKGLLPDESRKLIGIRVSEFRQNIFDTLSGIPKE